MTHIRSTIALAVFMVTATMSPGHAQDYTSVVQSAAAKWDEAFNKADAAEIASMYGAEAVVVPSGGSPVVGNRSIQQFWADLFNKGYGEHKVTLGQAEAKGDLGYAYGRWQATVPDESGVRKQHEGNWFNVMERQGDQWKIVLHSWN